MLSINKFILLFSLFFISNFTVFSQEKAPFRRCGNTLHAPTHISALPQTFSQARYFENVERFYQANLPTVVHVIYTTENANIGTGDNISSDQIWSQIITTNKDWNRDNSNKEQTLEEFKSVASNMQVNLKMALYDEDGNTMEEPGVNRFYKHPGSKGYFTTSEVDKIISDNIWNPEKYINIWVIKLSGDLLGYAYFPNFLELGGLRWVSQGELASDDIDGVVINTEYFGSNEFGGDYNLDYPFHLGRTTTHELGHYLGILHPWGVGNAGNCGGDAYVDENGNEKTPKDDFCDDTPRVNGTHADNPNNIIFCDQDTEFLTQYLCDTENFSSSMYQNFMDYTNDSCMTLFTADQRYRVDTVLTLSPARRTLNEGAPDVSITMEDSKTVSNTEYNEIFWQSEVNNSEIDIAGYIVEREVDGNGYQYISTILSNTVRSYKDVLPSASYTSKKISYKVYAVNSSGFSMGSNIVSITNGVVGIDKVTKDAFKIYPNPSTGIFTVNLQDYVSQNGLLEVYSTTGKMIYSRNISVDEMVIEVDLSKQSRGTYIMRFSSDLGIFTQRCIKN
ncbi:zinc-dependent metalloprotease [Flammeovirga agarivorans]|uniref:T9SS type A sorting domain-containing protein n=1 Tax=Flammeovirga agarivorans TaxID=2726742 RepID=A0A7X8XVF3_9BACT|nr:zinc-dependent metalloprotease [Flammeovirga agarivorans]NLR91246.1 T9SS type A sorting domain-containing protein [Flammeovirga agarivorans]